MPTTVLRQFIEVTGNYFNDLNSAVEIGLVKADKRHYPKKPQLYALIETHNASLEALTSDELEVEIDFEPVDETRSRFVDPLDEGLLIDDTVAPLEPEIASSPVAPEPLTVTVEAVVPVPSPITVPATGIKPVRAGTRKHLIFQELLLGITIADLAAKFNITKTYAHDYPNMARQQGYTVVKDADEVTYRIVLPVGMDGILTR